jgi:DNA polymerase-3 subunit epsilon
MSTFAIIDFETAGPIPYDVQELTGITDAMVRNAPEAPEVMRELHRHIDAIPLIAPNAAFDRKFLDTEYQRAGLRRHSEFACSMLLARHTG